MSKRVNSVIIIMLMFAWSSANAGGIWVEPGSFDVNLPEGCTHIESLTIGNNGTGNLNFTLRSREVSGGGFSGYLSGGVAVTPAQVIEENRIVLEYDFSEPVVSKGTEYDSVRIGGLESYERTGAPVIPVRPVTVLIPFGREVVSTRVISLDEQELAGVYRLPPAQKPYPLSYGGKVEKTGPNPAIYGQTKPWPGLKHEAVSTQSKRGYKLFIANLFPLQYTPATGKIIYAKKMQLEIKLASSGQANVFRPSKETRAALRKIVDNPKSLETYPAEDKSARKLEGAATLPGGGPYQYVIITNQSLANAGGSWNFQKLRDNKISKGMTATIVTTEWIYANYSGTRPDGGSDNQTRIRNFLIDAYQTWDTQYVLLGGTNSIVPARKLWVQAYPGGDIDSIPSDMYYGCVDPAACTFDYDADGNYGEPTDGVGGGEVDLYAEIYVGRAPVENATELGNFIKKTLTYDSTVSDYLPLITMVGEYLGFGGVAEYAKPSMEQIRLGGSYDGYFTYGFENHIQPSFYDFDTSVNLYDTETYTWPKSELINLMNSGKHVFNHLGHANYTYCMKLNNSDLASLTNTDYFFAYSQGCMPGGFDTANCFAETITSMEHGAFAVVMNARYGWGTYNSTDGPSQRFDRQYWDAVLGEGKLELGRANADSKEDNLWDINGECIRWCYYELNLFGDPQQQFRFEEACRWLAIEPQQGTVAPGDSCDINITFNTSNLTAGEYGAEIIVLSDDPYSPNIVPVTLTVNPDDLLVTPAENFEPNGMRGGPFEPASKTYRLENIGTSPLIWGTSNTQDWLAVEPNGGILGAGNSVDVTVSILPDTNSFDPNVYTDTIIFLNANSGSIKQRSVTLTVKPPDYFTELFNANDNDLRFLSVAFSPDGSNSYYEACAKRIWGFYTDPNGGTFVSPGDNGFAEVVLGNSKKVLLYGLLYDRFYIGSNGYITFGQGDNKFSGALADHFGLPRISGLFTDLSPASQDISYKQLDDRITVTFKDVPIQGDATAKNSFQIEMFFADGSIRVTWLNMAGKNGVAGLSEGCGFSPSFFLESNLNGYTRCQPLCDFNKTYSVDFVDFAVFAMHWLDEGCGIPYWCGKSDLDFSSIVDPNDLGIFADNWLTTDYWWLEPISHWKLDEGIGTTVYDSASTNNGTLYGAAWTTGRIDGALSFDGTNDYVDFGDIDEFEFGSSNFSIAFWLYTQGTHDLGGDQSGYGQIISKYNYSTGRQWLFDQNPAGNISFSTYPTGTSGEGLVSTNGYKYQWVHCVGVRDGTTKLLYINGVLDKTGTTQGVITGKTTKVFLGTIEDSSHKYQLFNGKIDDVRIYDRALSAQEIFELYQLGFGGKAFSPYPPDGATGADPNIILSWSPGKDAVSHDVYLGTTYSDVNDGTGDTYKGNYDANSYDPNGLALGTTYYWRIDERNPSDTVKGSIWSFKTWVEPNFVSWWKLDEGSGIVVYDSAGFNDGTIYGATWTTGQIDGALSFDGVNDYVEGSSSPFDFANTTFTVSAWFKTTGGEGVIVGEGGDYGGWMLRTAGTGLLMAQLKASNSSDAYRAWTTTNYNNNNWYHVAAVITTNTSNPAGNHADIYVDGLIVPTSEVRPLSYAPATPNWRIGARYYSPYPIYFNGKIDDVRIYNRALSAAEIIELYQQGLGGRAFNPYPSDGAIGVDPNVVLSWSPGYQAISHDVYFGTTNPPPFQHNQTGTTFDPGTMAVNTTYYWRIDEIGWSGTTTGIIWSFTTSSISDPNFIGWWKLDEGGGTVAHDSADSYNGAIYSATWATGEIGGALSFDGTNDYVDFGDVDEFEFGSSNFSIAFWFYTQGTHDLGGDHSGYGDVISKYNYSVGRQWLFQQSPAGNINFASYTSSGSGEGLTSHNGYQYQWVHCVGVREGSTKRLYINGDLDNTGTTQGVATGKTTKVFLGTIEDTSHKYQLFNGKIDDVRVYNRALSAQEVFELYQLGAAGRASNPYPSNGAVSVDPNVVLSWSPGNQAVSHDVYFGTANPPVFQRNQTATTFDPGTMNANTTYYWRIDEIGPGGTTTGTIWSFTTGGSDPDFISWWKFDETSGTIAYDSAGTNNGTVYGAIWTTGKIGGALSFDGVNDYVQVSDAPFDFGATTDFSYCLWVKTTSSSYKILVNKSMSSGYPYTGFGLFILSGKIRTEVIDSSGNILQCNTTSIISDGQWHFIAVVADRNGNLEIYNNGVREDFKPLSGVGNINNNIPLAIGRSMDYNGLYFGGLVDDVRIYKRVLSASEILQLYQSGLP